MTTGRVSVAPRAVAETTLVAVLLGVIALRQGLAAGTAVLAAASAVGLALASAAAHELGHFVLARRAGLAVVGMRLDGLLGGSVERVTTACPRTELRICLAGPAVTALLGVSGGALALLADGVVAAAGLCLAVVNVLALVGCALPPARSDLARAWSAWSLLGDGRLTRG